MHPAYDDLITARGAYFACTEDGTLFRVTCRACSFIFVYGTHADPRQVREEMDRHLQDVHPALWEAIAPAPLSTPSPPL